LSVRLDNGRQIEFNPNEHRHLDHGYAVTSHSSQGLTAEGAPCPASTILSPRPGILIVAHQHWKFSSRFSRSRTRANIWAIVGSMRLPRLTPPPLGTHCSV
jgi:hypothetical protein